MGLRGPGANKINDAMKRVETRRRNVRASWESEKQPRHVRMLKFIEGLPVTKGKLQGTKMKLLENQKEFIEDVYASRETKVRIAIKSEPRGNGKTGLLSSISLAHLAGPEAEPRGEVYSAAIDRQQAGIMFNEMEAIIRAVDDLQARINVVRFHKKIEVLRGVGAGSIYEALSSDARRAHGLAPSLWVYDELAQAKDRVLLDNLMTAMGKRDRSLGVVISTQAPLDHHPLSVLIDEALMGTDPGIICHLTAAPMDADVFDHEVIRRYNPALGVFLDEADVFAAADLARRSPAFEPAHRNLRMNQRVDPNSEKRIVSRDTWDLGKVAVLMDKLKGRRCYGGLDLSGKHDLASLILVFPCDDRESYDILCFFWTPKDQIPQRKPLERDLFNAWVKAEHLEAVPGPVIRFGWVAKKIAELSSVFDIGCIGYDRWRIDDLKQDLDEIGCTVKLEPFGQGFKEMAPALEYLAELALTGCLHHGDHPILKACMFNAVVVTDPSGNQKFDKEKSNQGAAVRIDGAVALAIALGTARRFMEEPPKEYQIIFV